ncbi:polyprenyl diphosphate synthase [bacterium]|nr:polyprenyl diphosphate synthase [bacterium]
MTSNGGSLSSENMPSHVAIIMDGNGRWAERHGLPRLSGHEKGVESVRTVLEHACRLSIRYVTVYAFSSENWERPEDEVQGLMQLFGEYLRKEKETFLREGIRLRAIGDRSRLPVSVRELLGQIEEETAGGENLDFILAVSYGGRDEIVRAARRLGMAIQAGEVAPDAIRPEEFSRYLDTDGIPDPDLLIRTSGEFRISNFLLWQLAYTEIVVTDVLWPDFSGEEFDRCLCEFSRRERRFGRRSVQESFDDSRIA